VVYAIPEFYNTRVLIINNKALKEVGLTADDIDTSDWAKITEANQKLMIKNGGKLGRIGFDPKMPEFLPLWAQINGATMLSEDGKTSNLEDPKIAEALRFTTDLIKAHGTGPEFFAYRETSGKDFFGGENQFATNVLGAFPMEQWYVNVLAENSPDVDITVKALKTKAGEETSFADGNSWAIPRGAKNPEAACQFMKQMTAPDTWVAAATERAKTREAEGKPNTGVYTGNREADRIIFSEVYKPSGKKAFDDAVQVILKAQESAFSLPPSPGAAQFDKEWRAAVDRVLNENVSPEEALKEADEAAQQALDEAAAGE
jgi:multiple sugar transport system substrate-binding protein